MRTISPYPILKGKTLIFLLLLFLFPVRALNQPTGYTTGQLKITFTNIRSGDGTIRLGLYDAPEQFTDHAMCHYAWGKEELDDGSFSVDISDLPRTTYAIAVLDDEDDNETMNYKLGLPLEGWGMSTNPSFIRLKAPRFEEVSFELDSPVLRFEIQMNYLKKQRGSDN